MSTIWHWFLGFLASLQIFIPGGSLPEQEIVAQEQRYGDVPEVVGLTSQLPPSKFKRTVVRLDDWRPPETEDLSAESIMIMDKSSGKILWSRSPEKVWPMASITKLMSAIIFMEEIEGRSIWEKPYRMTEADEVDGTVYIYRNEEVDINDLFHLSLIGSINSATRALFHAIDITDGEAVAKMNKKARSFGLWNTSFSDVTGLASENVTTAKEVAWLLKEALSYEKIQQALIQPSYLLTTDTRREVTVLNTNKLLGNGFDIEGGKTGFISESRYNFAVSAKNDNDDAVIIVVMGTDEPDLRFSEAGFLAKWAFDNYSWN